MGCTRCFGAVLEVRVMREVVVQRLITFYRCFFSASSNIINASADPAETLRELIVSYNFLQLGADAMIAAAPRTDSYNCTSYPAFCSVLPSADGFR
jgi:hypothetical protein